jgi:hypothetical protein
LGTPTPKCTDGPGEQSAKRVLPAIGVDPLAVLFDWVKRDPFGDDFTEYSPCLGGPSLSILRQSASFSPTWRVSAATDFVVNATA